MYKVRDSAANNRPVGLLPPDRLGLNFERQQSLDRLTRLYMRLRRMVWRLPMANSSSSGSESLPQTMTAFVGVFLAMQTVFVPAAALVAALAVTALLRVFLMM